MLDSSKTVSQTDKLDAQAQSENGGHPYFLFRFGIQA